MKGWSETGVVIIYTNSENRYMDKMIKMPDDTIDE